MLWEADFPDQGSLSRRGFASRRMPGISLVGGPISTLAVQHFVHLADAFIAGRRTAASCLSNEALPRGGRWGRRTICRDTAKGRRHGEVG